MTDSAQWGQFSQNCYCNFQAFFISFPCFRRRIFLNATLFFVALSLCGLREKLVDSYYQFFHLHKHIQKHCATLLQPMRSQQSSNYYFIKDIIYIALFQITIIKLALVKTKKSRIKATKNPSNDTDISTNTFSFFFSLQLLCFFLIFFQMGWDGLRWVEIGWDGLR